jgi:hypothetical protein
LKFTESKMAKPIELPVKYSSISQPERARIREVYIKRQKGSCWFCKELLNEAPSVKVSSKRLNLNLFPAGFLRHPIHLHHDHKTDLTIGAVHTECNGYLWQYCGE